LFPFCFGAAPRVFPIFLKSDERKTNAMAAWFRFWN
jgi:hypothetical protein